MKATFRGANVGRFFFPTESVPAAGHRSTAPQRTPESSSSATFSGEALEPRPFAGEGDLPRITAHSTDSGDEAIPAMGAELRAHGKTPVSYSTNLIHSCGRERNDLGNCREKLPEVVSAGNPHTTFVQLRLLSVLIVSLRFRTPQQAR